MAEITLNASIRTTLGRTAANAARRNGRVPGVFYLHNEKNIPIEVRALDLRPLVYTAETHIVDLRLDNGTMEKAVMKDIQFDPVTDQIVHFDLQGLVMTEKIRVDVPVVLEGAAPGVRAGGVLNHILHKLEVECLPAHLPEHITADISALGIGDVITVKDLTVANVTVLADPELAVVTVAHGRTETAVEEVAEEGPKEPEVIARGKVDEG